MVVVLENEQYSNLLFLFHYVLCGVTAVFCLFRLIHAAIGWMGWILMIFCALLGRFALGVWSRSSVAPLFSASIAPPMASTRPPSIGKGFF
jgi:hypothetical protein